MKIGPVKVKHLISGSAMPCCHSNLSRRLGTNACHALLQSPQRTKRHRQRWHDKNTYAEQQQEPPHQQRGQAACIDRRSMLASMCSAAVIAQAAQQPARAATSAVPQEQPPGVTRLMAPDSEQRLTVAQRQVLEINKRVQRQNNAPQGFPHFVREGFDISVLGDGYTRNPKGFIYKDFEEGEGEEPHDGQQVVFDYTAYNESGAKIDSSYQKGQPASTQLGINGLIPGFEMGIKTMRLGGKRRIVVPPELGPPTGPATFFSAKQCEVFDVALRQVKSCRREALGMFSRIVCD